MVIDFGEFKHVLRDLTEELDHSFIVEEGSLMPETLACLEKEGFTLSMMPFRTTAENLARYFYGRMADAGLPISQIEVYETPNNCAIYYGGKLAMSHSKASLDAGIDDTCLLPVVERFVSVNGEGPRAGRLAAFIRFAGCNLACSWCDTAWANVGKCEHEDMTPRSLVEWVSDTGVSCVTLTGGEPALQPGLPALVSALLASGSWGFGNGRAVEIETNGAVDLLLCMNYEANSAKSVQLIIAQLLMDRPWRDVICSLW